MAKQATKLTKFAWSGHDRRGTKTSGEISAESLAAARNILKKQGIKASKIKAKKASSLGRGKPIKEDDVAIFTRQMASMAKAGVPLVQSFEIVAEGLENPNMQKLVLNIRDEVSSGTTFAQTLEANPQHFNDLYRSLIGAGEQAGALETMLDRVATYLEKSVALKSKLKKAMTYPIAVTVVAFIVTCVLLIFVVPQFASTFQSFGAELPAFTQMVLNMSNWVQKWWLVLIGGVVGTYFSFNYLQKNNKGFRDRTDVIALKLPIFGDITKMSIVARFARTLSTTFAAGVPLVDALTSVSGATANSVYFKGTQKIKEDVLSGQQLNFAIRTTGLFPLMLMQMVAIGEEAGSLDDMLDKVATYYEDEVDNKVDSLTSLMEPIIMAILGVVVGGLLIAMYLPMFAIGDVVGG